jgi:hypothetical protein
MSVARIGRILLLAGLPNLRVPVALIRDVYVYDISLKQGFYQQ